MPRRGECLTRTCAVSACSAFVRACWSSRATWRKASSASMRSSPACARRSKTTIRRSRRCWRRGPRCRQGADGSGRSERAGKPGACLVPVAVRGARRDRERLGGLVVVEPAEIAALEHLRLARLFLCEPAQGVVDLDQLLELAAIGRIDGIEPGHRLAAAALECEAFAR